MKWLPKEQQAWKPPERLTVSEWADKNRILDSKSSSQPGKWKTDNTPYLREIMDTYNDPFVEEVVFCKPTQVGGTETGHNILGYIVDQDPSSILVVYPTEKLAEFTSENRIQPMLRLSSKLLERWNQTKSQRLELQFNSMYIGLVGANSPANLASRPVGKIIFDETDKYPQSSGKEADPISLGTERAKTFRDRKIYKWSTPTTENGQIWQSLLACDVIKQYFVPCPHCGEYQTLKLNQIKWSEDLNKLIDENEKARRVLETAWYECEFCNTMIDDKYRMGMLRAGKWQPVTYADGKWAEAVVAQGRIRKIGYHLNTIYSPWVSFGQVAAEFIKSKDYPEKLQNFINSWLGEPWRDKSNHFKSDIVLTKQGVNPRGIVPEDAMLLTAGVDIQLDHFWYEIRAWGEKVTSWLVDYGRCETWEELEEILVYRQYQNVDNQDFVVNLALIDSGFRTDEVYDFCAMNPHICLPSKGSSKIMNTLYTVSKIDKSGYEGLKLYMVNTSYFKDFILGRLQKNANDKGSWNVFNGAQVELRQYAEHICSEQKVTFKDKKGREQKEWRPVSSHAQNHLLDCAVYSACAAEILGVRYLKKSSTETGIKVKPENSSAWIPQKRWF